MQPKRLFSYLTVLLFLALSACERNNGSFVCHFGVPGEDQYKLVDTVGSYITQNYGDFADRSIVEKTHRGKTYSWLPGCVPSFQFYEIVEPNDIANVEAIARKSLEIAGIEKVHLTFYGKQNWITFGPNSGGSRGHEKILKSITVTKQTAD
jgi:hypothetical protein